MTRVFALSDIHLDHDLNARWLSALSMQDYRDDILLLAGDVSDRSSVLERCFADLAKRFHTVLYVPGNHDLWVLREPSFATSLDKYRFIRQ